MVHPCGSSRGEGTSRLPTAPIFVVVFDLAENPAEPVPAERADGLKPGPPETRVGDEDGPTALGQEVLQSLKELAVGFGCVVVLQGINLLVQREGSSPHRDGR